MSNEQLNPLQKSLLQNYLASRKQTVTVRSQLTMGGPKLWIPPIAFLLLGLLLVSSTAYRSMGLFLFAYTIGLLHYHFRRLKTYSQVWPVLERVLDWGKVEALAKDEQG